MTGNGKTSLRGGAGAFYASHLGGSYNNRLVDVTPFSPQVNDTPPPGPFSDPYYLQTAGCTPGLSPFPAPFPPPSNAVFPLPDLAVTYDPANGSKLVVPVIYEWNMTLEHQLANGWLGRIAYVGSHSTHLAEYLDLNPAVYFPGSTLSTDQRRIFQGFSNIVLKSQDINANYNSLQVTLQKRLGHGIPVTILANYTYSKSLDTMPEATGASGPGEGGSSAIPWYLPGRNQNNYGPPAFDHAHVFVASYVWDLPKLGNSNLLARGVLGNWVLSGIMTMQSGDPVTVDAGKDQSQTGLGNDRAVLVGAPYGGNACGNKAPCVSYLNPSSFDLPAAGRFGNIGKNTIRGPKLINWDMGFFKEFPVTERCHLPIRTNVVSVRQDGDRKTIFTNQAGPSLIWQAALPGRYSTLLVNGKPLEAHAGKELVDREARWVRLPVGAGDTVIVEIPSPGAGTVPPNAGGA